ncbi:unnamed protein product, partial [Musa hybrid cultivar]
MNQAAKAWWSIRSGLRRTMRTQNSHWLSAPSPSESPSRSMARRSSSPRAPRPSSAALRLRLSKVMSPRRGSMSRRKPLESSSMRPSSPSFSTMRGRKSSNSTGCRRAAMGDGFNRSIESTPKGREEEEDEVGV